jgi:hypothetical protein
MKNNRAKINGNDTTVLLSQLGDPPMLPELEDLSTQGERSIVLLDLTNPEHIATYEQLYNSPEDFEVLDEDRYGGRYTVFVVVSYIRKGQCRIEIPDSSAPAPKGRKKSAKKGPQVTGFSQRKS